VAIQAGTRLGPYEVLGPIGAGGMGEVYRARDPRLGREVAIKVLPAEYSADPERLKRFEREARAAGSLNHPNVLVIHDVGTEAGRFYVVSELLDGRTLGAHLRTGPVSRREALDWAVQVARGLAAAHGKGIVHRDIKPDNLFVTKDGLVKVLDFGLARWAATASEEATLSRLTDTGLQLGTAGYMSPEQVRALTSDARSDIFSFGVVLYELLSGRHPFRRETRPETQAAILRDEPPSLSGVGLPLSLERIVRRCLEKRPEDRFHSAHDVALALESVGAAADEGLAVEEVEERSPYPGLAAFTEADAEHFFGREAEVEALWEKLGRFKLLAVIGPSGVGKSSCLRAGLLPSRPAGWAAAVATPGRSPMMGLAQALAGELAGDADAVRQLLRFEDAEVALEVVGRWRRTHAEALVVVDQFEELFTLNPPETQQRFATLLGRLASETDVHVLISLRDDFLMRCNDHDALAPVFDGLTPLGTLTGDALRRAVVEPAKREGYAFEDEALVDEMLTTVRGERGALPLLAFAVSRLWQKRDRERKVLTRAAYHRIGGVSGALAQHAEAVLERIGADRERLVREMFRNLATSQGTRAACEREELLSAFPDRAEAEDVLRQLVDARLLTSYEVEGKEGERAHHRIEIVHESLLNAWPRLVRWQTQDADSAQLRDQLKQAAHFWDQKGRPPDLLWTGTAYREFEVWKERYPGALTALEDDFGKAMRGRVLRRRRLGRTAVAPVIVGLAGIAVAIGVARQQAVQARLRAETEALRAEASKQVALGKLKLETDPTAALAFARKSLEVHDSVEARRLVLEALWRGPVASVLPPLQTLCNRAAPSPDGQWLACSNWGNAIQLFSWDGKTSRVLSNNRDAARPRTVLFSDDSRKLATFAQGDPETVVWSVDGQEIARLRPGGYPRRFAGDELVLVEEPRSGRPEFEFVARRVSTSDRIPLVRVAGGAWDIEDPSVHAARSAWDIDPARASLVYSRERALLVRPFGDKLAVTVDQRMGEHGTKVTGITVHDGPGRIVSVDESRGVRIWDGATRRLLRSLRGTDPNRFFRSPALDPRSLQLAWHSLREQAFTLWDLAGPPDAEPLLMHGGGQWAEPGNAVFLDGGRWLATALNVTVAFWPLEMPWARVLRGPASASIIFTSDSKQIVACGTDVTLVYPVVPTAPGRHPITFENGFTCYGAAMDPSGARVLLAAPVKAVLLAPLDGGAPQALLRVPARESICPVAVDKAGRWAATAACYAPDLKDRLLHIVDRRAGTARAFPLPGAKADTAASGGVQFLRFSSDGRLMASGFYSGLRRWDPETGGSELLNETPCGPMDASADGRRIVVACAEAGSGPAVEVTPQLRFDFELLVIDATTGERRTVKSHGRDFGAVAVSPAGEAIATGDSAGSIRVGSVNGGEPHLLVGARGAVASLAFSPDGRWLASASGNDIRLWPMPDLSRPPLHTLPREALIAKLDSLTNVRVVADPAAPSGYKTDVGPFPGWKHVPTW
jgi:WD40 repeat protein